MPKSSKENSAVPRVTRSLRNRVVSVESETSGQITPTVKKDLESILEDDEQSTTSTQTTTPARGRPRRSSQSEAISTPVKTPARRLTRRTSLSELDNATISSPLRRSTRKVSTLVEDVICVEESAEEEEIIIEKQTTKVSSKLSSSLSNKIKTATANIATKKGVSKEKKSRSPSPLTTQEENDKQINKTQPGDNDKKHTSSVLPTVREEMEDTLQSQKSIPKSSNEVVREAEDEKGIIIEKRATRSSSNSPNTIVTENIDATKEGSRLKMLRSPSPKNSSNTTQEKNDNKKVESQFSGDSDKLHIPTVLYTACEEPQEVQKSATVDLVKECKEKENIEKQVPGSVLKSVSGLLKNNKTALEAGETKKTRETKGKKSSSPSRNSSNTTQEKNDNEKVASQSSGNCDKHHNPTVLSTACEEPQQPQKFDIVGLVKESKEKEIIIEKQVTGSTLKSPSGLLKTNKASPEASKTKKTDSKGKKSRSPSPLNISTVKEDNENQVGETQSSGKSDTILSAVLEDPMKVQQSSQSFCKSPLPKLLADKENEKELAPNITQSNSFSKLAVEISDTSSNTLSMKSPNPIEREQEIVSPTFKRVTRSASKSPVITLEKETRKEKLSKKNIKDSIAEASEDKQVVEESQSQKKMKISKEAKKGESSDIEIKETEITKTTMNIEPLKEAKKAIEVAESPKKITVVENTETGITKMDIQGEANEINKESGSVVLLANPSTLAEATQQFEKEEKDKISLETNSGLTNTTREVLNMEEKEEIFHQPLCEDFNDSFIIKADISINEIIAKCSDDKKEEEKENWKPEKNREINIPNTNLYKSTEHTSNTEHAENKSEDSKIEKFDENNKDSKNAEESIIDKSLGTSSAKDTSSVKNPQSESEICEAPIKEHTEVIGEVSSKNEIVNILDRSLSKSVEHLPNEESISSFSKSFQTANINEEMFDESMLNKTDLFKEKERATEKPTEDQTEVNKKQKSVVFDTSGDSEKASVNYPKTPICSKSKSYVADEDPNSSVDTSIIQKLTSKRAISLDDSKEPEEECAVETAEGKANEVEKPNTPLKKIKAATILSSTPIINSKQLDAAACGSFDRKKNTSLQLGGNKKDDKHGFSKSWSQAVIGKAEDGENGTAFIDALEHEKKKERDAALMAQVKKSQKDIKRKKAESSEDDDDDDDDDEVEDRGRNEFLEDEAMEVKEGEESMDSEERRYLKENEVPEHGESIGSDDTDQDEADEDDDWGEENSLNSFIASEADEHNELLSVDSAEFSSDESTDEEKKVPKKRSFNTSRRIESSDESDQDDDINVKTKKTLKLVIESSDEESKDHNKSLEIELEVRNEDLNLHKYKEQGKEKKTLQAIELDASSTRQDNEDVSIPCSKFEKKQQMPKELEKSNSSVISVNSSCMELSVKEVSNNTVKEGDICSTAVDKCQKNDILEDRATVEEKSAKIKSKSNDDEERASREFEQEIPPIFSKEIKRRSSLKTMSTKNKELENLKETGGTVIRNLNSSEETLSATEKTIHSKSVHEDETDRANTTNEDPILTKESDKELLREEPSDDANIKDRDEVLKTHTHKDESEMSIEPDIKPLEDLHKTKKGNIKNLKKRVFSASFTVAETESSEVEKLSLSFTSVPKKSKKIKENKETNQSIKKVLQKDEREKKFLQENEEEKEVLYGLSNLEEQSSSNNSSELYLDKTFTNTSQYCEVPKGKGKDKKIKTPKRSQAFQKHTNDYNSDSQENVEESTLEECYEEDAEISYTSPVPVCSTYYAKQFEAKPKQSSSDAKEIRDFSPILQVLSKSEARLETLIGMKQSINRKIKKMNMKLQQLYGNNSPKSNELLDEYETAIAVALKHGISLLGKQKRKVSRKLQKMNYIPSESEFSSEESQAEEEQKPQKTERKEKVVYTDNTKLIPSQKSAEPSTSRPKKRKTKNLKTLAETHEQSHAAYRQTLNFVKTTSGLFVEEPNSPEIQKTKKFRITSTLELPFGVVFEEAVTPTSKRVVNGFHVTQATPRAIGFKVESILSAGQKEVPSVKKPGIKRKLDLSESTEVASKPKRGNSGNFSVTKLRTGSSGYIPLNLNESASTHFMVVPLKSKKSKVSSQAGPSTMKAMEFKTRALSNKHIPRESSDNILQRKQKKKANQL